MEGGRLGQGVHRSPVNRDRLLLPSEGLETVDQRPVSLLQHIGGDARARRLQKALKVSDRGWMVSAPLGREAEA